MSISLDPQTTALVLIDLQNGILGMNTAPHSAADIVDRSKALAERFRAAGAPVVLVVVDFGPDRGDAPPGLTDTPARVQNLPDDWARIADSLQAPSDLIVTKRQWGAFYGTDLDLKLRRRGIKTIAIGGIATNFGVESTVRCGWEHGYNMVVVEDLCATFTKELHDMAMTAVFPRISRITQTSEISLG